MYNDPIETKDALCLRSLGWLCGTLKFRRTAKTKRSAVSFTEYAEDLEYHFGPAFNVDSATHEFFILACEYVEIYNAEVVSTDQAKIDEVFTANESI